MGREPHDPSGGPDKALFGAGTTGWVAPIPIVKQGNEWRFDVEAGRKEMQARLIGRNELAVIQTLLGDRRCPARLRRRSIP